MVDETITDGTVADEPVADESATGAGSEGTEPGDAAEEAEKTFDVVYSCLRCGTAVSNEELGRLPEIKCICGFRVFIKVRPPLVKSVNAV